MRHAIFAVGFAVLASSAPALAADRDFDLVNGTGYDIKAVFIDEAASPTWTVNSIDGTMGNGDAVRMHFGKGDVGCKWDMKVVFADDNSAAVWHGFDLCQISKITLKYNRNTDVTTAVIE